MTAKRGYRAICFDLDGTLLEMDLEEFMASYFARIAAWAGAHDLNPQRFMSALKDGTKAMAANQGDATNKEVFWDRFYELYGTDGLDETDVEEIANQFYDDDFKHIGDGFVPNPLIAKTIADLKEKGYPLVLTTMPMFPRRAVEHRLAWAGLDPASFERITTYENSKSTKPHKAYFAENLAAMGLDGKDVLMVGNNTMEDLAFLDLGVDAYLITDWLLDPVGFDLSTIKNGSFEEFSQWVQDLPDCADPARDISTGVIDCDETISAHRNDSEDGGSQAVSNQDGGNLEHSNQDGGNLEQGNSEQSNQDGGNLDGSNLDGSNLDGSS